MSRKTTQSFANVLRKILLLFSEKSALKYDFHQLFLNTSPTFSKYIGINKYLYNKLFL